MRISSEEGIMREQAIALNENKQSNNSSFGKYSFLMNITYVIILSHLSKMPFNSILSIPQTSPFLLTIHILQSISIMIFNSLTLTVISLDYLFLQMPKYTISHPLRLLLLMVLKSYSIQGHGISIN